MEIKLAANLKMETDIPIFHVTGFHFLWKTDSHAELNLSGDIDSHIQWKPEQFYNSRLKIWLNEGDGIQIIYNGYVVEMETKRIGQADQIFLKVLSATCLVDRKIRSRSFQNPITTYGQIVRETIKAEGGQVIRNQKSDKEIGSPIICYEETAWQFAKRMGGNTGNPIIPDIETGNPNLWFGMRSGKEVPALQEEQYVIQMRAIGRKTGTCFLTEGRSYYKIGDRMTYKGQKVTIIEVGGRYEQGELMFFYILENMAVRCQARSRNDNHLAGLGLWGTIKEVKDEAVKIALDIDHGEDTGNYFFPWFPETGNAFYAMPEKGSKALLYFLSADGKKGAVIHCLNKDAEEERNYKDRSIDTKDENVICLSKENVSFSKGGNHSLSLSDSSISVSTSGELKIAAKGKIRLRAKQITINTPEELNICQG